MVIDFTDLGLDLFAGTILGALGSVLELTAAVLASSVMPALFNTTTNPIFAGIVGLSLLGGAIFTKVGSRMYKATLKAEKEEASKPS